MTDKLTAILEYFSLRARVFQAGLLCHSATFDKRDGLGYIHVLRTGILKINSPGKPEITLDQPSLFFSMNPTTHSLHPAASGAELVCASFDFGLGMKNPLIAALPEALVLGLHKAPSLDTSLRLLFSEARDNGSGQQALLNRLIEVVIIQLLRELIQQNHLHIGLLAGLAEPKISKALIAMHEQPSTSWTLHDLARIAGMSRASFSAMFKSTVGETPGNYLTEWRIGVAQTLIHQGKPLQLIAETVGYANASALSRAFTTVIGVSPIKWKQLTHGINKLG